MTARQRKGGPRARGAGATSQREASQAHRRGAPPPRTRWPGGTGAAMSFVLPLALLAIAAVLIHYALEGQRAATTRGPDVSRMDPNAAYQQAIHISTLRDWRASLPYYRRAMAGQPGREWRPHFNYALVLNNLTLQFTTRAGQQVSTTRSSAERIRFGRAALDEFWTAVQLAPDGATRAKILSLRANMMVLWGFPWEAFASYRAASHEDSTRTDLRQRGDQFLALMHDPSQFRFVQPDSTMRLAAP